MARKQPAKPRAAAQSEAPRSDVSQLIAVAAYYRAQQRGFEPGHELDDWIAAEAEVRQRMEGAA
jgi:hypothetical protein